MGGLLLKLLILSRSVNKYGHHRQFFFLVISIKSSLLKPSSQMNRNLEGSKIDLKTQNKDNLPCFRDRVNLKQQLIKTRGSVGGACVTHWANLNKLG
jgi:hypothetical protein